MILSGTDINIVFGWAIYNRFQEIRLLGWEARLNERPILFIIIID